MRKIITLFICVLMVFFVCSCEEKGFGFNKEIIISPNSEQSIDKSSESVAGESEIQGDEKPEDTEDGEGIEWHFDEDTATLYIEGKGDMPDYTEFVENECLTTDRPWQEYSEDIEHISIGHGVTSIGDFAFAELCIEDVIIPNGVTRIGNNAFSGCELISNIEIPEGVTDIGEMAFYDCGSLVRVVIPASLESIGFGAFFDCEDLSVIEVDKNNKKYCDENGVLFTKDMETLLMYPAGKGSKSYIIPGEVTTIGDYAFSLNDFLENMYIHDNITSIGKYAFYLCYSIESISVPESVESIGDSAFGGCSSLEEIKYYGTREKWNEFGIDSDAINGARVVFCGDVEYSDISSEAESVEEVYEVTTDSDSSIEGENTVEENTCGDNLTWYIDENANILYIEGDGDMWDFDPEAPWYNFRDKIKTVTISYGVTSIGDDAFWCCDRIENINIPDSVTSIGGSAFQNCISIKSIKIPVNVSSIGDYAFLWCEALEEIIVDENNQTFCDKDGVVFTKDMKTLVYHPERKISSNYTYNIPDGVTRIGVGAFRSCAYLYEVTVPDSVTVLDELAFAESVNIRDLKLSDKITDIGFRALSSLDSLVSIEIPDSVVNIAEKAFWDCESLERIHFAGTKQQWNNYGLTGEDISYAKITFGK